MIPTKFAVALYPGVRGAEVDAVVDIFESHLERNTALMGTTFEAVKCDDADGAARTMLPTHSYHNPPDEGVEVFIIPGGEGARDAISTQPVTDFIAAASSNLKFLLAIGTGNALAARGAALRGKRAAVDKENLKWVCLSSIKEDVDDRQYWRRFTDDGSLWTRMRRQFGLSRTTLLMETHGRQPPTEQST